MNVIPIEVVLTETEEKGKASLDASGTFGASWRIMLFRAVRDGDTDLLVRVVKSHPTSIHEHFTNGMQEWELSWESLRFYEFADATALYLASAYCRVKVVEFLFFRFFFLFVAYIQMFVIMYVCLEPIIVFADI